MPYTARYGALWAFEGMWRVGCGAFLDRWELLIRNDLRLTVNYLPIAVGTPFAWIVRNRRMSKDYGFLPETSEAFIHTAMSRLMLERLVKAAATGSGDFSDTL